MFVYLCLVYLTLSCLEFGLKYEIGDFPRHSRSVFHLNSLGCTFDFIHVMINLFYAYFENIECSNKP